MHRSRSQRAHYPAAGTHAQQPAPAYAPPAYSSRRPSAAPTPAPPAAPDEIAPALGSDAPRYQYDVRVKHADEMRRLERSRAGSAPVFANRDPKRIRLVSRYFPWKIDITRGARAGGPPITVRDVWKELADKLQERMEDSEWGFIMANDPTRAQRISLAAQASRMRDMEQPAAPPSADSRIRRVDWLIDKTIIMGLEKDDDFARRRLFPGEAWVEETWIVKMGRG